MKEVILYILKGEENKTQHLANDRFDITIMTINPDTYRGCCGRRCTTIYLDAALANKRNQLIIDECIKPACKELILI